jgi:hypothetical protein
VGAGARGDVIAHEKCSKWQHCTRASGHPDPCKRSTRAHNSLL